MVAILAMLKLVPPCRLRQGTLRVRLSQRQRVMFLTHPCRLRQGMLQVHLSHQQQVIVILQVMS